MGGGTYILAIFNTPWWGNSLNHWHAKLYLFIKQFVLIYPSDKVLSSPISRKLATLHISKIQFHKAPIFSMNFFDPLTFQHLHNAYYISSPYWLKMEITFR